MRKRPVKRVVDEIESYSARDRRQGKQAPRHVDASRLQDQRDVVKNLQKPLEEHKPSVIHIVRPAKASEPAVQKPLPKPPVQQRPKVAIPKQIPLEQARYGWELRSLDGGGNNLKHPNWGRAETPMLRYAEACSWRMDQARELSNQVCASDRTPAVGRLSLLWVAWAQLVDHELSLVLQTPRSAHLHCVEDPEGRESYPGRSVEYNCSEQRDGAPINSSSSYLDASVIYGLTSERAAALRTWRHGKLILDQNLLPKSKPEENYIPQGLDREFFLAGNPRVNESALLLSLQTVLVREHNFWCQKLADSNPSLSDYDEMLYQQARAIVIGIVQSITYNEWLPLFGIVLEPHRYDEQCNPGVSVEFAMASKLWLPMLPAQINIGRDRLPISQTSFRPELAKRCDELLVSASHQPAQPLQEQVVDALRNASDGQRVGDQVCELIQRARDHRCADYAMLSRSVGVQPRSLQELGDPAVQTQLKRLEKIDAWLGACCEPDHQLFKAIVAKQLRAVRDGDRFWYSINPAISEELRKIIDNVKLSQVLKRHCKGAFGEHAFVCK